MSVVASHIALEQYGLSQGQGRATSTGSLKLSNWRRGLPRPYSALPYCIVSVWRSEENGSGNDILIIVNGLLTIISPARRRKWRCHSGANNTAEVGRERQNCAWRPAREPLDRCGQAITRGVSLPRAKVPRRTAGQCNGVGICSPADAKETAGSGREERGFTHLCGFAGKLAAMPSIRLMGSKS